METANIELIRVRAAWHEDLLKNGNGAQGGVSFKVMPGEWCVLIGDNGVGKSTLLQAMSGSCRHVVGSIRFLGHVTDAGNIKQRFELGVQYVPQEVLCRARWTLDDVLQMTFENRPALRYEPAISDFLARVRTKLLPPDSTNIEPRLARLLIALLSCPSVILFDEIGEVLLSVGALNEGYRFLKSLCPESSVVFVEHELDVALQIADLAVMLEDREDAEGNDFISAKHFKRTEFANMPAGVAEGERPGLRVSQRDDGEFPLLCSDRTPDEHIRLAIRASSNPVFAQEIAKKAAGWWPFLLDRKKSVQRCSGGMKLLLHATMKLVLYNECQLSRASFGHLHPTNQSRLKQLVAVAKEIHQHE